MAPHDTSSQVRFFAFYILLRPNYTNVLLTITLLSILTLYRKAITPVIVELHGTPHHDLHECFQI